MHSHAVIKPTVMSTCYEFAVEKESDIPFAIASSLHMFISLKEIGKKGYFEN